MSHVSISRIYYVVVVACPRKEFFVINCTSNLDMQHADDMRLIVFQEAQLLGKLRQFWELASIYRVYGCFRGLMFLGLGFNVFGFGVVQGLVSPRSVCSMERTSRAQSGYVYKAGWWSQGVLCTHRQ